MKRTLTEHDFNLVSAVSRADKLVSLMRNRLKRGKKLRAEIHRAEYEIGPFLQEHAEPNPLFARVELREHPVVGHVEVRVDEDGNSFVHVKTKRLFLGDKLEFDVGAAVREFKRRYRVTRAESSGGVTFQLSSSAGRAALIELEHGDRDAGHLLLKVKRNNFGVIHRLVLDNVKITRRGG